MTEVTQLLTNAAFGFPRGKPRRIKPVANACIHITGNSKTAAYPDLHKAAQGERNYANRTASPGPSATHYTARDGWRIKAIDWKRYTAWSNGDVSSPNTANAGIRRVLALRAKGYNANEGYWVEIENVGYPGTYPITAAQKQSCAEVIAEAARFSGLPINRETVHGHWEINGIDRQRCPDSHHEAFLNDVIARAKALLAPTPAPSPEATMPALATYTPGQTITVKPTANVRDDAKLTAKVFRTLTSQEVWTIVGSVEGEKDPEGGSTVWYLRWWAGHWEYTAASNLSSGPTAPVVADPKPLINAALDKARANALAGTATAIETAIKGARPA